MKVKAIFSWLFALWASYVFLGSLFYKFTDAIEPQHIFSTIGDWLSQTIGTTVGELFANFGQYLIGGAELITALVLLSPIVLQKHREKLHCLGGLMASAVMAGAVFFHIFTPLGWVPTWCENLVDGARVIYTPEAACLGEPIFADFGLANAALSILILGLIVFFINKKKPSY